MHARDRLDALVRRHPLQPILYSRSHYLVAILYNSNSQNQKVVIIKLNSTYNLKSPKS